MEDDVIIYNEATGEYRYIGIIHYDYMRSIFINEEQTKAEIIDDPIGIYDKNNILIGYFVWNYSPQIWEVDEPWRVMRIGDNVIFDPESYKLNIEEWARLLI